MADLLWLDTTAAGSESADGRRQRRSRNRDAVVDALLDLYREGSLDPSTTEVAERAGLSPRSVFRYFDDVDDLCRAAIARQHERVRGHVRLDVDPRAPLEVRAAALAAQRSALFEAIGAVGQVSRLRAPFQPLVAAELTQARAYLRSQVELALAPELAAVPASRAAALAAAADVLCSFEAYQLLRHDQRLSRARARAVLSEALCALFAAAPSPPRRPAHREEPLHAGAAHA